MRHTMLKLQFDRTCFQGGVRANFDGKSAVQTTKIEQRILTNNRTLQLQLQSDQYFHSTRIIYHKLDLQRINKVIQIECTFNK